MTGTTSTSHRREGRASIAAQALAHRLHVPPDPANDALRKSQLQRWATDQVSVGDVPLEFTVASADASFRRYFRLRNPLTGASWVAMDSPPDKEPLREFVHIAVLLARWDLDAPRVLAVDAERGFALLSDLGTHTMLDVLDEASAETLYAQAIDALATLQANAQRDSELTKLPIYDTQRLLDEMLLFPTWYLNTHLGVALDDAQHRGLEVDLQALAERTAAQPHCFVHRDFHSRNLMAQPDGSRLVGMLDFQDAVRGPVTYDIVSLLKDCYVTWPAPRRDAWLQRWADAAMGAGLLAQDAPVQQWFDDMGLQRHLKVLGIFARLHHRDGKSGYLGDLPRVLDYVRPVLAQRPDLPGLQAVFDAHVWTQA